MNGIQAVREVEQRFVSARTIAATDAAFATYRERELPAGLTDKELVLVEQGFQAGYHAAVGTFARIVADAQTAALRGPTDGT